MKPLKLLTIISNTSKALAFEWMAEELDKTKFDARFILINETGGELEDHLKRLGFSVTRMSGKNRFMLAIAFARINVSMILNRPHAVHCHLLEASLLGLLAARLLGIKKRIYTRHHSTLNHRYFPRGVRYDLWCNKSSTHIVAVCENVKRILVERENTDPKKITVIRHGLKLDRINSVSGERVNAVRAKYRIPQTSPVVGIISRYIALKGVEYGVAAFRELLATYPSACLILANAGGDHENIVRREIAGIPKENVIEITFENDLFALYRLFDVFLHVPIDIDSEAFGQTYIESLASGIPSVFTFSGVAPEFIRHEFNALVVDHKNKDQIVVAITRILTDQSLRERLIMQGKKSVEQFSFANSAQQLISLYLA